MIPCSLLKTVFSEWRVLAAQPYKNEVGNCESSSSAHDSPMRDHTDHLRLSCHLGVDFIAEHSFRGPLFHLANWCRKHIAAPE